MPSKQPSEAFCPSARRRARQYAVQALYQWLVTKDAIEKIEREFQDSHDFKGVDRRFFHELLYQVPAHVEKIEAAFSPFLDRSIQALGPVERTVLRMGAYELLCCPAIPYKVAIHEAVGLAKQFGAAESHNYINAMLDKLARSIV